MRGLSPEMALVAAGLLRPYFYEDFREAQTSKPRKHHPLRDPSPNDFGPVIDSTRESKRARRRRLAREASHG